MKRRNLLLIGILTVLLMSTVVYNEAPMDSVGLPIGEGVVAEYTPHGPIIIQHDNFTGWPGSGTPESPYVIEGLNITADTTCIAMWNTSSHYVIRNCYFHYTGTGFGASPIWLYQSNNSLVENCYARTHWYAVQVEYSHNSNITNSEIVGTIYTRDSPGVRVENNFISSESSNASKVIRITPGCDNAFVYNNTIDLTGISATGLKGMEIWQNANVTVQRNYVKNVDGRGIWVSQCPGATISDNRLQGCVAGIVTELEANLVENNVVFECETGILINGDDCVVFNNSVFWNSGIGMIAGAADCTFYNNYIGFNTNDPEQGQAIEASWLNFWDDGVSQGNYWSDYDGVSDNYTVSPRQHWNGVDHYPQVFEESTIDSPSDIEYEVGDTGHAVTWNSDGTNPVRYELQRDGIIIDSDAWDGLPLMFLVSGLPVGEYMYTLTTLFESKMWVSDSVVVTVASSAGPLIELTQVSGVPDVIVDVTATVTDMSGVDEVILSYSVNGSVWTNVTMTQSGGLWVAQIPAQVADQTVEYKVYASDELGNWAVSAVMSYDLVAQQPPPVSLYIIAGVGAAVVIIIAAVMMKRR